MRLVDEVFAEAFEGFAGVVGDVGVFGVGEAVEIGPEKSQAFAGNHLHRVVNPLGVLTRQSKTEAVQGLALAEASKRRSGGLADIGARIAAGFL